MFSVFFGSLGLLLQWVFKKMFLEILCRNNEEKYSINVYICQKVCLMTSSCSCYIFFAYNYTYYTIQHVFEGPVYPILLQKSFRHFATHFLLIYSRENGLPKKFLQVFKDKKYLLSLKNLRM